MQIILKNLQKKIPIPAPKVLKAAKAALRKLNSSPLMGEAGWRCPDSTFSIVFVGPKRMRAINKKYLKHDYVTDVLTFDLGDNAGEIIICPQTAVINARIHQSTARQEIILYVIHGILHLAGYDDRNEKDKIQMRRMEKKLIPPL